MVKFHAQSVEDCWRIARHVTEHYQALANLEHYNPDIRHAEHVFCCALRDVADAISQCILNGTDATALCLPVALTQAMTAQVHERERREREQHRSQRDTKNAHERRET